MENKLRKMTTPKALLINVIWLSVLLVGGYYVLRWVNKNKLDELRDPDRVLLTKRMSVEAKTVAVLSDRGFALLELDNSQKISIEHSRNYDYSTPWLNDFLQVGDHLLKNKNSDTLWIKRGVDKYYFVIGEFINEKK